MRIATNKSLQSSFAPFSLAERNRRSGIIVVNNTDDIMYLLFGQGVPTAANFSLVVTSGATLSMGVGEYNGPIQAITIGIGNIKVTEFFE